MKKLVLPVISLIMAICLCSCSGGPFSKPEPTPMPEINPVELLTEEDVYAGINYAYVPVLDGNAVIKNDNVSTALYRSEPIGQGDPVQIQITQPTDTVTAEMIWEEYDNARIKRPSAALISGIGEDAYIAFPSIHVFDKGYHIEITAGSGSDENQKALLVNLASTAVQNFEEKISASK